MENPILGLLAERLKQAQGFAAKPFGYSNPPAEMLMNLLGIPAVQQTMERMAYGEPLTTGRGMTTQVRPEVAEAALTVAPFAPVAGRAARGTARIVGQEMADRLTTGRSMLPSMLAEPKSAMFAVEPNVSSVRSPYPQQASIEAAQRNAENIGQSVEIYPRSLQQGYEHGWYHGSTGDIKSFNPSLLGEATGAASAKKGFFFARDPQNPPESLLKKTTDESSIEMLRKLGIPEEEIAKLNTVSMEGHGAETASGYAQIGGSRQYKEAMRKANSAEKRGDWDEYEKQMALAENIAIGDQKYLQTLTAKYGDSRDKMLANINNAIYSKQLPQKEAELLDAKVKELMPYGWYNSYSNPQLEGLKKEIAKLAGNDANQAIKSIEQFQSIKNERALAEKTQEGGNVMPVALRYKNPMVYDFQGKAYREQTYSDLIDQALSGGHDALILKNTFDPGGGPAKLVDVGVVFDPSQIRSTNAAFDPMRRNESDILAGLLPASLLADPETRRKLDEELSLLYTK